MVYLDFGWGLVRDGLAEEVTVKLKPEVWRGFSQMKGSWAVEKAVQKTRGRIAGIQDKADICS